MSTHQDINALRAQRIANTHDPLALMANTQTPFHPDHSSLITYIQHPQPNNNFVPQPSFNTNYPQHPMQNPGDISNPTTAFDMALALMAKAFTLNNTTPTNNNQRSSSNPSNMQIAHPDRMQCKMSGIRLSNLGIQTIENQNGLSVVLGIANLHGNGNVVVARAKGNSNGINENQIRCYNCRGEGHYARNCTVKPRKRDAAYLQQQLQIAQKEEAEIQSTQKEFDFMAAAGACEETKRANTNCILENNLQQASSSGTQSDEAPVYDSDGSAENNSNVISEVSSVEQSGGIVDQHPANVEETRAYFESLYNNLATEVEKVNLVNRKMKETNAELTTELARYKNQEKCFEISQEKYDKLERCYQKSVYQEQCLTKKINALHLSSGKQITTLNEEISNLSKQLSTEKSTVSSLLEEKKKLKSDFKIREDELLDKQIQLENKIKELDNILVKTGQSIQTMHMLSPKPDSFYHTEQKMALGYQNPFYLKQAQRKQQSLYNGKVLFEKHDPPAVHDSEETLQLAQESRLKMKQLNKEIKPANYTKINHLSGVFVSQTAKSREESYFSNTSKMANVSKPISIPNEEFSEDTTPSVARKFLNEENKYAKLWNDWYKKCEECKYDKISYEKAYNDMQQKIERLQAQLGDQKGKSKDTPCVSNTLDPLSKKLENENVELEFQVSEQKDTTRGMSANTKFAKQSILGKPPSSSRPKLYVVTPLPKSTAFPKVDETNALSKPVTSNSVPSSRESTVVNNKRVIAPGIFRINPFKAPRGPKKDLLHLSLVNLDLALGGHQLEDFLTLKRKIITSSESESQSDFSKGDNACTSNPQETIGKWFPSSTFSMTVKQHVLQRKRACYAFSHFTLKRMRNLLVFNSVRYVVSKSSAVTTADASDKCQQQHDSTSSTSTLATTVSADGNFDFLHGHSDAWQRTLRKSYADCFISVSVINNHLYRLLIPRIVVMVWPWCSEFFVARGILLAMCLLGVLKVSLLGVRLDVEGDRSYKAVKVKYIRSMIQPEPKGSTQEHSIR
ncbi:copia protein [Tanacetum coccineum]